MFGDGVASVLAKLRKLGPEWCKRVKKIACANHACKGTFSFTMHFDVHFAP